MYIDNNENLTLMENSEYCFHIDEQLDFLDNSNQKCNKKITYICYVIFSL